MGKIRKIKTTCLILILSTLCFAFKIDELEFNKIMKQNERVEKIFTITNNELETKIYKISIEGDKNVKVTPSVLNLLPQESKKIKIEVIGKNSKGNYEYFLVIREINKNSLKKGVNLNKIIKIKQKYIVE